LAGERNLLRTLVLEQLAKKLAQTAHHFVRGAWIFVDSSGYRVEGVEQKMRFELQAKVVQLRFREACFESGLPDFTLTSEANLEEEIDEADANPIEDEE